MHAADGWINTKAMIISRRCASCCRSAVFRRSRRRRWLPMFHRLPPWGDPWLELWSSLSTGKMFVWLMATLLWARFSTVLLHTTTRYSLTYCQTVFNDFFEVCFTKRRLYHQNVHNWLYCSVRLVQLCRCNDVISQPWRWLVNHLTAVKCCIALSFKYVNINRHQSIIFSKSIVDSWWQQLSFSAKLARS